MLRQLDIRPHPHSERHEVLLAECEGCHRLLRRYSARRWDDLGELLSRYSRPQFLRLEVRLRRLHQEIRRRLLAVAPRPGRESRRAVFRRGALFHLEGDGRQRMDEAENLTT